jgi:ubiquitin-protein ligase
MSGLQRLKKELKDIISNPPDGITAGLVKDSNPYDWIATLIGPAGTPYAGAVFTLNINFPKNYPFKPPNIKFATPIFHCNVSTHGIICLDILKDNWSPALTTEKVLMSINCLLIDPNPNDPLVPDIANLFRANKPEHDRIAREHAQKYALNQ